LWCGGLIPFHRGIVDIRGLRIPWRNVAALYWGPVVDCRDAVCRRPARYYQA